jgi:hypothetical protein
LLFFREGVVCIFARQALINLANEEAEDARDAMAQGGAQAHAAEKPLRGWHGVDTRQPPASLHRRLPV